MGIDGMDNLKRLENPKYVGDETPESYLNRISQLERVKTENLTLRNEFDAYTTQYLNQVRERLDYVCLQAMQGGKHGVKVTTNQSDGSILMEVSEDVPFGEIHYHTELGNFGGFE